MKPILQTENPLVLRTDFSDQAAWASICATIQAGVDGYYAYVEFVDEVQYKDLTKDQLLQLLPRDYAHTFLMIVDQPAISLPDHPLLIVDLCDDPGREFRAIPSQIQSIENNLSIANMDFEEFAESVDEDGVFRGFPEIGSP
jgi:hypothetical protein